MAGGDTGVGSENSSEYEDMAGEDDDDDDGEDEVGGDVLRAEVDGGELCLEGEVGVEGKLRTGENEEEIGL